MNRTEISPTGYLRIVARLTAIVAMLVILVPVHGLWRLFRLPSPWPRHFLGAVGWIVGARRWTSGAKPLRDHVFFISNHLSWLDILVLAGATGSAFIAKAELKSVPLIGWLCALNRTIFVARGERMNVAAQIAEVRAAIERGWAVTVFPEGTTGDGETLLPFKASLLAVLDPAPPGVRVQPVALDYGLATADVAWLDEGGVPYSLRLLARRGSFPANLRFAEPFDPAGVGDRKAIAAEARRRISELDPVVTPLPLSDPELNARRPVWLALSGLFLDTDVSLMRDHDARILAASPYTLAELERILIDEVGPAVRWNMYQIAGEWAGFDADWLERKIRMRGARSGKRINAVWPDWVKLGEATALVRAGANL